jgi:hypothetical protein
MLTAAKSKEDEQNSRIRDLRKRTNLRSERKRVYYEGATPTELLPSKENFSLKEKRICGEMPNRVMRNEFFKNVISKHHYRREEKKRREEEIEYNEWRIT